MEETRRISTRKPPSTSLLRTARSLALPVVLVGGLLLYGAPGAGVVEGAAPSVQYMVAGELITASGAGYSARMVGDSLYVTVTDGAAQIQIGDQQIDLGAGDAIVLAPVNTGSVRSISMEITHGEAIVSPALEQAGVVDPTMTMLTAASNMSFPVSGANPTEDSSSISSPEAPLSEPTSAPVDTSD